MKITVYLGSHEGSDPFLKEAVKELGVWIAENNHILVYGGSKIGLMGELADSVLNADGMAIGVEPEFFIDDNLQHENLSELIITSDLQDRKRKMIELGDAFIAFPGGTGTLDEITENDFDDMVESLYNDDELFEYIDTVVSDTLYDKLYDKETLE